MTKEAANTVWITRTQPSADESAKVFRQAGFHTVEAPLLTIKPIQTAESIMDKTVLVFTSQNGVHGFCRLHHRRDFSVVTVGDATAQLARDYGFKKILSAGGTSDDIAPLIAQAPVRDGLYVHVSGQHVRGSVSQDIQALGLSAERRIYYRSVSVQSFPIINLEEIKTVVLFSPLAGQTLAAFAPDVRNLRAVSISAATDVALEGMNFQARCIAAAPTLESLIAATRAKG